MEYKHTKGPWEVKTDLLYNIDAKGKHVAMVSCFQEKTGDKEENEANARLIAAAPELLEALERMLIEANDWDGPHEGARIQAKAAIAKAIGETK